MNEILNKIYKYTISFFQISTALILYYIILSRFLPRPTVYIFENPSYTKGYFYLFLLFLNFLILYVIFSVYKDKPIDTENPFFVLGNNIHQWIENSYRKVVIAIGDLDPPRWVTASIYFIMEHYVRIPLKFLRIAEYIPRLLFVTHFFIEVIFFHTLHYCFYTIYLLLFTFLHRSIQFFTYEWQKSTQDLISESLIYDKWHSYKDDDGNSNLGWHVRLSEKNKHYDSVEEAQFIGNYVSKELYLMKRVKTYVYSPLWFHFIVRSLYIISFSYILYNYSLPILRSIFTEILNLYFLFYNFIPISFFILLSLVTLSLINKPKDKVNIQTEKIYNISSQENKRYCDFITDFNLVYEDEKTNYIYWIGILYSKNTFDDKRRSYKFSDSEHFLFKNSPTEVKNDPDLINKYLEYADISKRDKLEEFAKSHKEYDLLFQEVMRILKELNISFKVALTPEEKLLTPLNKYILLNKEKKQ